jgi:hypothetical protein
MNEMDVLVEFLLDWGKENDFSFVLANKDDDKNIDFININLKTKTIYIDELNIIEPLTEVG